MKLSQALRLSPSNRIRVAFVGAGGKTTAMFQLACELAPCLVTASTHLGAWQASAADRHFIWREGDPLPDIEAWLGSGVTLLTGAIETGTDRLLGLSPSQLEKIDALAGYHDLPLLVEADGARQCSLKAPAEYEPVIPPFSELVIVMAGLSALGKPLTPEYVHRPERFSELTRLDPGAAITLDAIVHVLADPNGGLKNIPSKARRVVLLNQADTPTLQATGQEFARRLLPVYQAVLISSRAAAVSDPTQSYTVHAVHEPVAGIVLAAGGSVRAGTPKQLLDWGGEAFVTRVARTALEAGLAPVIVVTGAFEQDVVRALRGFDIRIANNPEWETGQSSSVRSGMNALPPDAGAAIFLLVDQPQIPATLVNALAAEHAHTMAPIIAPLVDGRRGNPVCFDRNTFHDLLDLQGDTGGRVLFSRYPVSWLPWHDVRVLIDVDTPEDYEKLNKYG